jgi:D-sedoheptulose 7-phosphate isomerase
MKESIYRILEENKRVTEQFIRSNSGRLVSMAQQLATCFASGHKLFLFGNGGSAADAQHIAAEFVNRFAVERRPLPALALTTDTSILTAVANDYGYRDVFSKQIIALGQKDDIALGISTSGTSPNVIAALEAAQQMGIYTMGFGGPAGKGLDRHCRIALTLDDEKTARIQEAHITAGHILCDLVDRILFPEAF